MWTNAKTAHNGRKSKETFYFVNGLQDSTKYHKPKISISLEGLSEIEESKALYLWVEQVS